LHGNDIGVPEIIAFEQQRLSAHLGQRVQLGTPRSSYPSFVRRPLVQYRQCCTTAPNVSKLRTKRGDSGTPGLAREPLTQSDHDRFSERLSGPRCQLAGQAVSLWVLDTQSHDLVST